MRKLSWILLLAALAYSTACEDDPRDLDHLKDSGPAQMDEDGEGDEDAGR